MTCCVCYEEEEVYYNCDTCKEGKICLECFIKKSRPPWDIKSRWENLDCLDREDLLPILSCPCCRTINWKVLFRSLLISLLHQVPRYSYSYMMNGNYPVLLSALDSIVLFG